MSNNKHVRKTANELAKMKKDESLYLRANVDRFFFYTDNPELPISFYRQPDIVNNMPTTCVGGSIWRAKYMCLVPLTTIYTQEQTSYLKIDPFCVRFGIDNVDAAARQISRYMAFCKTNELYLAISPRGLLYDAEVKLNKLISVADLNIRYVQTGRNPRAKATYMMQSYFASINGSTVWIDGHDNAIEYAPQYAFAVDSACIGAQNTVIPTFCVFKFDRSAFVSRCIRQQ